MEMGNGNGKWKWESQAAHGENLGLLALPKPGTQSSPVIPLPPKLPGGLTGKGLFFILWSDWRIWERPWQ